MSPAENEVRDVVRRVLTQLLAGPAGAGEASAQASQPAPTPRREGRSVIDEAAVRGLPAGARMAVPPGAVVTPLAREAALVRGITLQEERVPVVETSQGPAQRRVAIGADHGGFPLKETLKSHLQTLGYEVVDCGTHSTDAVDYPDFAYAVARLVADGKCANGIVVDGAGIGSCMVANKVPGVRAALCYDHATAVNSREHNHANVLTLGAGLIGSNLARQIVSDWLATPYGSGRHARRVEKIMAIEKRYLKP